MKRKVQRYDAMIWSEDGRSYDVAKNVTSRSLRSLVKKHGLSAIAARKVLRNGRVRPVHKLALAVLAGKKRKKR